MHGPPVFLKGRRKRKKQRTLAVHLVVSHSSSVSLVRPFAVLRRRPQTAAWAAAVAGTALSKSMDSSAAPLRYCSQLTPFQCRMSPAQQQQVAVTHWNLPSEAARMLARHDAAAACAHCTWLLRAGNAWACRQHCLTPQQSPVRQAPPGSMTQAPWPSMRHQESHPLAWFVERHPSDSWAGHGKTRHPSRHLHLRTGTVGAVSGWGPARAQCADRIAQRGCCMHATTPAFQYTCVSRWRPPGLPARLSTATFGNSHMCRRRSHTLTVVTFQVAPPFQCQKQLTQLPAVVSMDPAATAWLTPGMA